MLEDVVDGLGLSRAALIGNSVGGFAAARLAITRPESVAGLVLVNTGGFVPLNPLSRTFCRVLGTPAVFRATAPLFVRGYMKARTDSDRQIVERTIAGPKPPTASGPEPDCGEASPRPSTICAAAPPSCRRPRSSCGARNDIAIPLSAGRATHDVIRGSRLEILDTGHVVFSSDPHGFLAVAEPFLESVALRR